MRKIQREQAELERLQREEEEAERHQVEDAVRRAEEDRVQRQVDTEHESRLKSLRDQGEFLATLSGAPSEYRAATTRELSLYVTREQFPASLSWLQAYELVKARVAHVLKPWREQTARDRQEQEQRRHHEDLLRTGRVHAYSQTNSWEFKARERARREVERVMREEVKPDWTREDVTDLVDDVLDEWEG